VDGRELEPEGVSCDPRATSSEQRLGRKRRGERVRWRTRRLGDELALHCLPGRGLGV
jgi:hypothetical protein